MNSVSAILRARSQHLKNLNLIRIFSTDLEEKIEIPRRIHRGPTDILRALESTINKDPTAAHYKYHDDPFLIPMSNTGKRAFAMAQEAGRKAAQWVRAEHPELFQHKEADPPIPSFYPKVVFNEKSEVSEDDLKRVIREGLVSDAAMVYKLCKSKNLDISTETQQSLLEMLCYTNCSDSLAEDLIEERWFKQSASIKEKIRKTWNDGSLAEELFISIENPGSEAYSALIQGMAKYYQVDRAWQLFEEAQQKGIILSPGAFNAIISVANFLKESYEMRWTLTMDLLSMMQIAKVKPNLGTLNAVLEVLSTSGISRATKEGVLMTLSEFRRLGVEPCLTSWYYVLITYCKERGPRSSVLYDILNEVENKEHQIQDIRDTYFFVTAMDICRNHLHDKELAMRVHKLLLFGNNYNLIGDSFKESIYYRHYVILMCNTQPLDQFMENTYYQLIPHIYVPEPSVMGEILQAVEANGAIEYLPKIWSDMTVFDHTSRERLVNQVLHIMTETESEKGLDLNEKFAKIGWDIFEKVEGQSEHRTEKLTFTGEMLGNIMTVVLQNNDFAKATQIMEKLDKGHHVIVGVPRIETLELYVNHCILEKSPSKALTCIQYCADSGFPQAEAFASKLEKELTLDQSYLNKLEKIVGSNVLGKSDQLATENEKKESSS